MIALSFSSMKDMECPFRFNALKIAKTYKEPSTPAMEIGSVFATMIQAYREHCFKIGYPSDLTWWDIAGLDASLEPEIRDGVLSKIEAFKGSEFAVIPVGKANWWKMEWQCAFDADLKYIKDGWYSKDAAFRAVVDFAYRTFGELVIIDDKTGRATPDPLQLQIYAHLLPRAVGMSPDKITCIFNNVATGKHKVMEFAPGLVSHIGDMIKAKIEEVNSWKEFPAKSCKLCRFCRVPGCPVRDGVKEEVALAVKNVEVAKFGGTPALRLPDAITDQAEAEKALLFVEFAEGIIDDVKSLLRGWVEQNGSVTAGDKIADLRENTPWKAGNIERIVRALAAYGIPTAQIWGALSLSESALEKLLKKNKQSERLAMLLNMGERKEYKPRFGIYNQGSADTI